MRSCQGQCRTTAAKASAVPALLALLTVAACADEPPDSAPPVIPPVADSAPDPQVRTAACRDPASPLITGQGVGGLAIGASADEVRDDCRVAGDTTLLLEGQPQPALLIEVGSDTVIAEIVNDLVWRINVVTPGPATEDSLRVGTPVRHLARYDSATIAHGEGQRFVLVRSICGLSFEVGGLPGPFGRRWTMDELLEMPDTVRVTRILIVGCHR